MLRTAFSNLFSIFSSPPSSPELASAGYGNISGPSRYRHIAFYFVHGASDGAPVPLTLQEALENGAVSVRETGTMNALSLENLGNAEVFIQAGDIVKGGRQDRVLSNDLWLPARSGDVPIAAYCVEPGRWTARQAEEATKFSSADASMPSHSAKLRMHAAGLWAPGREAHAMPAQAVIWEECAAAQERLARSLGPSVRAEASRSSLQLSLETEKVKGARKAYIDELQTAGESGQDIVGSVVAINGKIKSGDIYASNALFRKMWSKILAAGATEAIGETPTDPASPPKIEEICSFLAGAQKIPQSECGLNHGSRLITREGESLLCAELQRSDGSWVHQNYLAK
jgi:hypothetical protein